MPQTITNMGFVLNNNFFLLALSSQFVFNVSTWRWLFLKSSKDSLWFIFNMFPKGIPSEGISLLSAKNSSRRISFIFRAPTKNKIPNL